MMRLEGRPWLSWGPPVDGCPNLVCSPLLVERVAQLTGRAEAEVLARLTDGSDPRRYLLLEQLSVTGHSALNLAVDRKLAREVAIKTHRDWQKHRRHRAIFESQRLAQLSKHPNIVQIHDVGEHVHERRIWLYAVFERGDCDLYKRCVELHQSLGETERMMAIVTYVVQAGRGLEYLHATGYIHCDIKPANIIIVGIIAKLADFGSLARPGSRTRVAQTLGFIAPEFDKTGPSPATDVYSLARTLKVCLFLELPFVGPADGASVVTLSITDQQPTDRPAPPPRSSRMLDAVCELIERALDPHPRRRPSLAEFLGGLQAILDRFDQFEHRKRRRRRGAVVAVALVASLVGAFAMGDLRHRGERAGSLVDTALGGLDPLTRAELAASMGKGELAMEAVYRAYDAAENLPESERIQVAKTAERVARTLEAVGQWADAMEAQVFAVRIYERTGHTSKEEAARAALEHLLKSDPYQSR